MNKFPLALLVALSGTLMVSGKDYLLHTFKKTRLSDKFWCEGANFGDFNHDGKGDIVSGPYWYEGPDFQKRHEYYPATQTFKKKNAEGGDETIEGFEGALGSNNSYSDNFFAFAWDFNKDGWDDILILGFPGDISAWYENPKGREGHWQKHIVLDVTDNESPTFTDLTGDGKPEIVCSSKGAYGYAEPDWSDPARPWNFHPISPNNKYGKFTHGMGVGDVNGDGRPDLLEKDGWWEQPKSLAGDPVWTFHPYKFGTHGAHGDVDPTDPAVIYWFQIVRNKDKTADIVPHRIDDDSGVGTQVVAGFCSNKKYPDVVVGNKKGTFYIRHDVEKVGKAEWEKAQPKPANP